MRLPALLEKWVKKAARWSHGSHACLAMRITPKTPLAAMWHWGRLAAMLPRAHAREASKSDSEAPVGRRPKHWRNLL